MSFQILEFESIGGGVIIEAHDSHHVFMHSDCISSQMSPRHLSARIFEYLNTVYLELSDSQSKFCQGFSLPTGFDLREVGRFFLSNYGFTPRFEGVVSTMPLKEVNVVDSLNLRAGNAKTSFGFSLLRNNSILLEREGFYGGYPAQMVGIGATSNFANPSDLQVSLSSTERNVSHISISLWESQQKFDHFLNKYRQPKH